FLLNSTKAQQQTNFYATLFYNSTNNTITTTYYINNTANGNCNMKIAVLPLEMQWNPSVLTLQSFRFIPTNQLLDYGGLNFEEFPSRPDANISLTPDKTVTVDGQTKIFYRRYYRRSTNLCDLTLVLPCEAFLPVFEAVFTIPPALAANYDFTTPAATNYIGEFISSTSATPSTSYRELVFVANRLFDQAGADGTCPAGAQVGQINNVPNSQGGEVFVNTSSPLPVEMKYFEVYKQNSKIQLQWETAYENDVKGFEIQRKTGDAFETIGYLPSKMSDGAGSGELTYTFNDNNIINVGTVYYRLRQINYFSKESYSEIKAIRSSKLFQVMVYPNPSRGTVNIVVPDGNGTTSISVVDYSGRLIKTAYGYKLSNIQLNNLPKGIYSLVITNMETGEKTSQKIKVY
ncbi:MAG TPA: T9SS type A sorting domain-containing protein, partial [Chitinophagaceae bacterium]|nr:T9SS type A sorting domain-containing protein [Chitinophagaceae bacterium]